MNSILKITSNEVRKKNSIKNQIIFFFLLILMRHFSFIDELVEIRSFFVDILFEFYSFYLNGFYTIPKISFSNSFLSS